VKILTHVTGGEDKELQLLQTCTKIGRNLSWESVARETPALNISSARIHTICLVNKKRKKNQTKYVNWHSQELK
jgi:hypothetical protein